MILFDFPSGLWGFWSGAGSLVFEGVTYVGAGSLLDLSDIRQSTELAAIKISLTLRAIPNTDLTPDILATIEQEQYHQRPVRLMTAFFDPDTEALLSVEVMVRGIVDRIVHNDGDGATLECQIETRTRDITKSGYRVRSDADQKMLDPTDDGLRHVATVHTETIYFGRLDGVGQWWKDEIARKKSKKGLFG